VRLFYDLQAMRIAGNNRGKLKKGEKEGRIVVDLNERDRRFMLRMAGAMEKLEAWALTEIKAIGQQHPMWDWLNAQVGIAETLSGFILAEFDPTRAERPSSFCKFAGLHVEDKRSPHRHKGKKLDWSSRVRAKMIAVLGSRFLMNGNETYKAVYDKAKADKLAKIGRCMACDGEGVILSSPRRDESPERAEIRIAANSARLHAFREGSPKQRKKAQCWNCEGKRTAAWGRGPAHRHAHANRLMVKRFLADLWVAWRGMCKLPIVPPYSERGPGGGHLHKGRYGTIDGKPYTGPTYPDEQGYWPAEYGWSRDKRPDIGKVDRFGRRVTVKQQP